MALQITQGKVSGAAIRAVIYGTEGIGKSTLATKVPHSLVIDFEDGTKQIECKRVTPIDWRAGEAAITELTTNPQGFQAVIIDTADWCEKALIENMLKRGGNNSIEDYGYGKGYVFLAEEFTRFLNLLDKLIAKGVHVIFVAHSTVKRLSPPDQTDGYDRYEMKLTKQVSPLLKEWADMVLFVNYKIQVVEGTDGRLKAQGGKERVIFTTHSPAWDAKNRYGLPDEMPMDFAGIAHLFGAAVPAASAATITPPPVAKVAPPVNPPVTKAAPQTDDIPGLGDTEQKPVMPPAVAAWLDTNAAPVNAYLVRVQWVPAGKTWRELPADKMSLIIGKPDKFARAAAIPALG